MKITKSHTSTTETVDAVLKELKKVEHIDKVSTSIIKNTRSKSGQKSVKITQTGSGLKLSVRGNGAVQDLYIYSDFPEKVEQIIKDKNFKNIKI